MGAFSSVGAYRHMRYERQGLGLAYSFVLVALFSLLFTIYGIALLNGALFVERSGGKPLFDDVMTQITEQWPEMTVENGTVAVQAAQPHVIMLRAQFMGQPVDTPFITFDTTGATTHENMRSLMLVTANEIIARDKDKVEIYKIADLLKPGEKPLVLDRDKISNIGHGTIDMVHKNLWKILGTMGLLLWFFLTMGVYLLRIAMLLVLAGAGIVLSNLLKSPLDYATSMRLAALAYTPIGVIDVAIMSFAGVALHPAILFALGILMLSVAIDITRKA